MKKSRRRRPWLVPGLIATVLFVGNLASNVVAADMQQALKPYMFWVSIICLLSFVVAIVAAIIDARTTGSPQTEDDGGGRPVNATDSIVTQSDAVLGGNYVVGNGNVSVERSKVDGDVILGDKNIYQSQGAPQIRGGNRPPQPSLFIGREEAVQELKIRLRVPSGNHSCIDIQVLTALRGWPGVGKSTLAAMLANDMELNEVFTDGVLWASLGQSPDILSELSAWGRALGLDDLLQVRNVEEASLRLASVLRNKQILLIIDDVWDAKHVEPFRVGGSDCAMLVVTRRNDVARAVAPTPASIYTLDVLDEEKALEFLRTLAPSVVHNHPEESLELVRELDGLPLALQVAGRLLNAEASYGFGVAELLAELRTGCALLEAAAPSDRTDLASETTPTVVTLLEKSLTRLDPVMRQRFAFLGVFPSKPVTFDIIVLSGVWEVEDPKPTLRVLIDYGLLEPVRDTERFQMHAVIKRFAAHIAANNDPPMLREAQLRHAGCYQMIAAYAEELYKQGGERVQQGLSLFDAEWENIKMGQAWAAEHEAEDRDAAVFCDQYAAMSPNILNLRLHPLEQITWLEAGLRAARQLDDQRNEMSILISLGIAYCSLHDLPNAIETYEQVLAIAEAIGERSIIGKVSGNIGNALYLQGDLQRATEFHQRNLAIARETGDREEEGTAIGNLGLVRHDQGDQEHAIELYEQQLAIARDLSDPRMEARALCNLGVVFREIGEYGRAITVYEEVFSITRRLGDRKGAGIALANLSNVYIWMNEFDHALEFQRQHLAIARETGDPSGEAVALFNGSVALYGLGRRDEAIVLAHNALVICEQIGSPQTEVVRQRLIEWQQ